ncbi:hypothetical protein H257_13139 [Aphanomyces astaci]|uniref:Uncharacterized protein n=1 Tax=Aphanomyces astaci TaxID=112090 RepID=W4FY47_APHAT|nr:hypothetical protein H257_13139 [Aphanomyces astaci]ETV71709.1 hypothetical protein H257_13139 [Aphanomyces astaci]|eukprot:XP_009838897.1 hypothetical protein H257_13139 [Aphanomyces astaci]
MAASRSRRVCRRGIGVHVLHQLARPHDVLLPHNPPWPSLSHDRRAARSTFIATGACVVQRRRQVQAVPGYLGPSVRRDGRRATLRRQRRVSPLYRRRSQPRVFLRHQDGRRRYHHVDRLGAAERAQVAVLLCTPQGILPCGDRRRPVLRSVTLRRCQVEVFHHVTLYTQSTLGLATRSPSLEPSAVASDKPRPKWMPRLLLSAATCSGQPTPAPRPSGAKTRPSTPGHMAAATTPCVDASRQRNWRPRTCPCTRRVRTNDVWSHRKK